MTRATDAPSADAQATAPPPQREGEPLLRAQGVWKVFGPHADRVVGTPDADLSRSELRAKTGATVAVRDVSLEIWPGEVFVVMGLSGSGKSTLVRTLIRLIEPTAGEISILGSYVMAADPAALRARLELDDGRGQQLPRAGARREALVEVVGAELAVRQRALLLHHGAERGRLLAVLLDAGLLDGEEVQIDVTHGGLLGTGRGRAI